MRNGSGGGGGSGDGGGGGCHVKTQDWSTVALFLNANAKHSLHLVHRMGFAVGLYAEKLLSAFVSNAVRESARLQAKQRYLGP